MDLQMGMKEVQDLKECVVLPETNDKPMFNNRSSLLTLDKLSGHMNLYIVNDSMVYSEAEKKR